MIRCKFKVTRIEDCGTCDGRPQKTVTWEAVTTGYEGVVPEDQVFSKYTPSGSMTATINNPRALAVLAVGKTFYVDLTPCEQAVPVESVQAPPGDGI